MSFKSAQDTPNTGTSWRMHRSTYSSPPSWDPKKASPPWPSSFKSPVPSQEPVPHSPTPFPLLLKTNQSRIWTLKPIPPSSTTTVVNKPLTILTHHNNTSHPPPYHTQTYRPSYLYFSVSYFLRPRAPVYTVHSYFCTLLPSLFFFPPSPICYTTPATELSLTLVGPLVERWT